MTNMHGKSCSQLLASGKCKLNPQDSILHQLEWLKYIVPNADKDVEQQEPSSVAGENVELCCPSGKQLALSYKDKYACKLYDLAVLLGIKPREVKTRAR